jgi:hypothetical protein
MRTDIRLATITKKSVFKSDKTSVLYLREFDKDGYPVLVLEPDRNDLQIHISLDSQEASGIIEILERYKKTQEKKAE